MRILFQGDSITDCGRDRGDDTIPCPGYAGKVAGYLSLFHRGEYEVLNRGVSGDDTGHLLARWETDCLALEPGLQMCIRDSPCHTEVFILRAQAAATLQRDGLAGDIVRIVRGQEDAHAADVLFRVGKAL